MQKQSGKIVRYIKAMQRELSILIGLLFMGLIFSAIEPIFISFVNIRDIFDQATIFGLTALGMTFVIITGGIDLSVGSVFAIVGVITAKILVAGVNPVLASITALILGTIMGSLNGFLVTKMHLQAFIATMGTMSFYRGVVYIITDGLPVINIPSEFRRLVYGDVFAGIRGSIFFLIIFAVIAHVLLKYTPFGNYIYAIGGNEEATRLSGVEIDKNKTFAYILCGIGTALAAVISIGKLGAGESTAGQGLELNAIAAAAIGGTSLAGGRGTIIGTFIGAIMFSSLKIGLIVVGVDPFWQYIATGLVIITAAYAESLQAKIRLASEIKRTVQK